MHLLPVDDVITAPAGRPILVGEASRAAVTIAPDATMRAAADRMREHDTDRLVVVEDADHVIGVVTGNDLLRTITRRGNLLREVVEQQVSALGAARVQADVDHSGVVLLTGTVDSLDARDRLLRAVGALNGVTEVDGLLSVLPDADAGWTPVQAPSTTES
jgi:CBS domain-containing protein